MLAVGRLVIDPVKLANVEVVTGDAAEPDAKEVAAEKVQEQLHLSERVRDLRGPTSTPKSWAASDGR